MKQKLIDFITKIGESKGWRVDFYVIYNGCVNVNFQRYSPAGHDFNMSFEIENNNFDDFLKRLDDYYEDFNPDGEALLWCDEDGHGRNGAPKRLKDIIIDFESVENDIKELVEEFDSKEHKSYRS